MPELDRYIQRDHISSPPLPATLQMSNHEANNLLTCLGDEADTRASLCKRSHRLAIEPESCGKTDLIQTEDCVKIRGLVIANCYRVSH